jgi:hypothetical protein
VILMISRIDTVSNAILKKMDTLPIITICSLICMNERLNAPMNACRMNVNLFISIP